MMGAASSSPVVRQKRKRPSLLSIDQSLVGISIKDHEDEENATFMLHKGLLCNYSPYFRKAFKGNFRESLEGAIYLPGVNSSTLRLFQFWLYGQSTREQSEHVSKKRKRAHKEPRQDEETRTGHDIYPAQAIRRENEVRDMEIDALLNSRSPPAWLDPKEFLFRTKHRYLQTLARLYAFADVFNTPQLRQDVMTILVELTELNHNKNGKQDSWQCLDELYRAVPSSAPICRYAVKRTAVYGMFDQRSQLEGLPQEFLADLVLATVPLGRVGQTKLKDEVRDSCNFHEHKNKDEIIACKKRQRRDGAFYVSFLRACMSEVYALEEEAAEVEAMLPEAERTLKSPGLGSPSGDVGEELDDDQTLLNDDDEQDDEEEEEEEGDQELYLLEVFPRQSHSA